MDQQRLQKIVLAELTLDIMKFQEDLEVCVNSDVPLKKKIGRIKKLLRKINESEIAMATFSSYFGDK